MFSFICQQVQCQDEDEVHPSARVSRIPIRDISNGGGVVSIYGSGFAADNFNQFEPDLGNKVDLDKRFSRFLYHVDFTCKIILINLIKYCHLIGLLC